MLSSSKFENMAIQNGQFYYQSQATYQKLGGFYDQSKASLNTIHICPHEALTLPSSGFLWG